MLAETATGIPPRAVALLGREASSEKQTFWHVEGEALYLGWTALADTAIESVVGSRRVRDSRNVSHVIQLMRPRLVDDRIAA